MVQRILDSSTRESGLNVTRAAHGAADGTSSERDSPLPSVEQESGSLTRADVNNTLLAHSRTPSLTISPPVEGESTREPSSYFPTRRSYTPASTLDGMGEILENLDLSTPSNTSQASNPENREIQDGGDARGSFHRETSSIRESREISPSLSPSITHGIASMTLSTNGWQAITVNTDASTRANSLSPDTLNIEAMDRVQSTSRSRSGSRRSSGAYIDRTPHNVQDETIPDQPFHTAEFQNALSNTTRLAANMANVLRQSSSYREENLTIARLQLRARELSCFRPPTSRIVGLVGDSGVGKSSVINCLLDYKGLARTSNSGVACTCVVTEFHYRDSDEFEIAVEYFNVQELREQFSELLGAYRRFYPRDKTSREDGGEQFEEKAKVAHHTFQAAFGNRFLHEDEFVLNQPEEVVIDTFIEWTQESRISLTEEETDTQATFTSANVEECAERLQELSSDLGSEQTGAVWPFIRKIRVSLKSYILSKGLILADLPGLRDSNLARVRITERFMLSCDEIFAVSNIGRATSDAGVEEVFRLAQKVKLTNVGILCTKSDDITADEAERDWHGEAKSTTRKLRRLLSTAEQDVVANKTAKEELEQVYEPDEEWDHEGLQKLQRLMLKINSVEGQKRKHEFSLKSHLMNTRNAKVTSSLQQTYQQFIPDSNLRVFCVSNKDYREKRDEPKEKARPFLELSGILDVRRYCISIIAERQLRVAKVFMEDELPAFLQSIELWVQAGSESIEREQRGSIRDCVAEIRNQLQVLASPRTRQNDIASLMNTHFVDHVSEPMKTGRRRWSSAAKAASDQWHRWHSSTYFVFCSKDGKHSTHAVGFRDWNAEAIEKMVQDMVAPWEELGDYIEELHDDHHKWIEGSFNEAVATLYHRDILPDSVTRSLGAVLRHIRRVLLFNLEQLNEKFRDDLFILETATFTGIHNSVIGEFMCPFYRACDPISGKGSDARRKEIIERGFADAKVFKLLQSKTKTRFFELTEQHQKQMDEKMDEHLQQVFRDLDMLSDETAEAESEKDPEFCRLVQRELHKASKEIKEIKEQVERITLN